MVTASDLDRPKAEKPKYKFTVCSSHAVHTRPRAQLPLVAKKHTLYPDWWLCVPLRLGCCHCTSATQVLVLLPAAATPVMPVQYHLPGGPHQALPWRGQLMVVVVLGGVAGACTKQESWCPGHLQRWQNTGCCLSEVKPRCWGL